MAVGWWAGCVVVGLASLYGRIGGQFDPPHRRNELPSRFLSGRTDMSQPVSIAGSADGAIVGVRTLYCKIKTTSAKCSAVKCGGARCGAVLHLRRGRGRKCGCFGLGQQHLLPHLSVKPSLWATRAGGVPWLGCKGMKQRRVRCASGGKYCGPVAHPTSR